MADGLGGLTRGLLAGADLGMRIREQEARRSREAEDSLLRARQMELQEEQNARAQESHESNLNRLEAEEKRAQSQEARAQESHEEGLRRYKSQEKRAQAQEARAQESHEEGLERLKRQEGRAQSQEARLQKQQNWDIQRQQRQDKEKNLLSMAPVEFNRVLSGGSFSPEFMQLSEGTQYDPRFMATPEYKNAAKVAYETADKVVAKFNKDPNSIEISDYNQPDFIAAMNVLLGPNVRQGVGEIDPNTGKEIESKRIVSILPSPDGKGFVFDVKTRLSDGTEYVAPITENRTTDPEDPVKVIPFDKLLENINGSMQMASAFDKSDLKNYMTANFPIGGKGASESSKEVTKRQWLREQGDVDKWEMNEINKIDPLTVDNYDEAVSKIKDQAASRRERIDERYGNLQTEVGAEVAKVPTPSGGGEVRTDVQVWAEGDPGKRRFMEEAQAQADARGVENPFNAYSPSELDAIYREWVNDAEADELASQLQ